MHLLWIGGALALARHHTPPRRTRNPGRAICSGCGGVARLVWRVHARAVSRAIRVSARGDGGAPLVEAGQLWLVCEHGTACGQRAHRVHIRLRCDRHAGLQLGFRARGLAYGSRRRSICQVGFRAIFEQYRRKGTAGGSLSQELLLPAGIWALISSRSGPLALDSCSMCPRNDQPAGARRGHPYRAFPPALRARGQSRRPAHHDNPRPAQTHRR